MSETKDSPLDKFLNGYRVSALVLLNILVALVLLNAVLSVIFMAKDALSVNPVSITYGHANVTSVYHGMSSGQVDDLLKETWSRPYIYEPSTSTDFDLPRTRAPGRLKRAGSISFFSVAQLRLDTASRTTKQ
jgi:hypothetical protein